MPVKAREISTKGIVLVTADKKLASNIAWSTLRLRKVVVRLHPTTYINFLMTGEVDSILATFMAELGIEGSFLIDQGSLDFFLESSTRGVSIQDKSFDGLIDDVSFDMIDEPIPILPDGWPQSYVCT